MNRSPVKYSHDPMPPPPKGRHVVPHPRRKSKEYPKEKYYSVANLDMDKFRDTNFGSISMSTFGDVSCSTIGAAVSKDKDDSDHVVPLAEELPRIMEDSLTLSHRLVQDEAPVYFRNLPTNYASSTDDDDDDSCYDDVLNDDHTNKQPMVQEASQQSLYMSQTSALSAYEEQSVSDDISHQEVGGWQR